LCFNHEIRVVKEQNFIVLDSIALTLTVAFLSAYICVGISPALQAAELLSPAIDFFCLGTSALRLRRYAKQQKFSQLPGQSHQPSFSLATELGISTPRRSANATWDSISWI
jgi:hypothetical protein